VGFELRVIYFGALWAVNRFCKGKYKKKVAEMDLAGLGLLFVAEKC
jgi:hypothetical protein